MHSGKREREKGALNSFTALGEKSVRKGFGREGGK
jgi:hypothetical protein